MASSYRQPPDKETYHEQVWGLVRRIPAGRVATYGQIASMVPPPEDVDGKVYLAFGPRWVGGAMAACPPDVPWHRVVNAQGKISVRAGSGHDVQQERLEAEGVLLDNNGRIDLDRHQWRQPGTPVQGRLPF